MQYFKEYYVCNKFIGYLVCEKDRQVFGYSGRVTEIAKDPIKIGKRVIKSGTEYVTLLYPMCIGNKN